MCFDVHGDSWSVSESDCFSPLFIGACVSTGVACNEVVHNYSFSPLFIGACVSTLSGLTRDQLLWLTFQSPLHRGMCFDCSSKTFKFNSLDVTLTSNFPQPQTLLSTPGGLRKMASIGSPSIFRRYPHNNFGIHIPRIVLEPVWEAATVPREPSAVSAPAGFPLPASVLP